MHYDNNPNVVEAANDLVSIQNMAFTPGDETAGKLPELAITFSLNPHKQYNPTAFHVTDGVNHRILTPLPAPAEPSTEAAESVETEPPPAPAPLRAQESITTETDTASDTSKSEGATKAKGKKATSEG